MYFFQIWIQSQANFFASLTTPDLGCIPLTMDFYYVFMYCHLTRTSEANSSETICSATLDPGLNVCLCATCNATHIALIFWLIFVCIFETSCRTTPMGGRNVQSQIGSYQCCMCGNPPGASQPRSHPQRMLCVL